MYVSKLEEALQSIPGCGDVMLPYWDETSDDSVQNGIPWALTQQDFVLDGVTISNPLRSFGLTKNIKDYINGDNPGYSKPKGYETVRDPLSGLVGTETDRAKTKEHPKASSAVLEADQSIGVLRDLVDGAATWRGRGARADGRSIQRGRTLRDGATGGAALWET